jgi:transmembrane sensor
MSDKSKILAFPDTATIEAEAAAWVARFDAGDVSARDQAAFQEWLNRSALHRNAIGEYGSLWSELDALRLLTDTGEAQADAPPPAMRAAIPQRAWPWLAACAAAVIAGLGSTIFLHPKPDSFAKHEHHHHHHPAQLVYETAIGGQRRITLADGSSVILNTNSRLDVNFSANRRDLRLVRGEAYFDVVHDKVRPFTVHASNYVVRDIGTAFDIHLSKSGLVEVGVTKGSVEVMPAGGRHGAGAVKSLGVLLAGHNIVLGQPVERVEVLSAVDMGRKLAWRQGDLIYTGQPLREVLADISRYSDIKIELADAALEDLPVGGAFRADQIGAIFAALENNFGIHAEWIDPQHVRFTSGHEKPPSRD